MYSRGSRKSNRQILLLIFYLLLFHHFHTLLIETLSLELFSLILSIHLSNHDIYYWTGYNMERGLSEVVSIWPRQSYIFFHSFFHFYNWFRWPEVYKFLNFLTNTWPKNWSFSCKNEKKKKKWNRSLPSRVKWLLKFSITIMGQLLSIWYPVQCIQYYHAYLMLLITSMAGFDKDFSEKTLYALMGIFPTTTGLTKSCE